jgi:hypothetical protein
MQNKVELKPNSHDLFIEKIQNIINRCNERENQVSNSEARANIVALATKMQKQKSEVKSLLISFERFVLLASGDNKDAYIAGKLLLACDNTTPYFFQFNEFRMQTDNDFEDTLNVIKLHRMGLVPLTQLIVDGEAFYEALRER